uniref:Uncharacterized protein n=1 Tax=Avena sativa TaxID=4498 RepID=A0ACD5T6W4_AVESA
MEFRGHERAGEADVGSAVNGNGVGASGAQVGSEVRYQECLRNHVAAQGGHVVDGCGEFMPTGDGDGDGAHALRCAACGCHRSFHRKDDGQQHYQHQARFPLPHAPTTPRVPLLMPPPPHPYSATASHPHAPPPFPYHYPQHHHQHQHTPSGGTTTESSSEERGPGHPPSTSAQERRKRFRTRFTAEQKEQMLALAERVGWRMQRQDESLVENFCALAGVRRQVFKVWMHNNKQHHSRRQPQPQEQHSQQDQ